MAYCKWLTLWVADLKVRGLSHATARGLPQGKALDLIPIISVGRGSNTHHRYGVDCGEKSVSFFIFFLHWIVLTLIYPSNIVWWFFLFNSDIFPM